VLVDTMRGLAALSVILFHVSILFVGPNGNNSVWGWIASRNVGQPDTCVIMFFLISGFVLYRPFVAARYAGRSMPSVRNFAIRRAARVLPAYWVALAIATVWVPLPEVQSVRGALRYGLFLQAYGPEPQAVMGLQQAWTLCVELPFYFALPVIAWGVRRLGARVSVLTSEVAMCLTLMLLTPIYQVFVLSNTFTTDPNQKIEQLQMWLPGGIGMFAIGMLFAVVSVDTSARLHWPRWLTLVDRAPWLFWLLGIGVWFLIVPVANIQGWSGFAGYIPSEWMKALNCSLMMLPVIFGELDHGWLRRLLGLRPLVWFGTITYGVYLWHVPLLTIMQNRLVPHGAVVTFLVLMVVTIAFGAASWYLIERPSMRLARRYLRARSAAQAQPIAVHGGEPVIGVATDRTGERS
jgi:peptidoglycan/LPS O-acetylase OafA/YrhL